MVLELEIPIENFEISKHLRNSFLKLCHQLTNDLIEICQEFVKVLIWPISLNLPNLFEVTKVLNLDLRSLSGLNLSDRIKGKCKELLYQLFKILLMDWSFYLRL